MPSLIKSSFTLFDPGIDSALLEVTFITTLITLLVLAVYQLSTKELITKCLNDKKKRDVHWNEFKARFEKLIIVFLRRALATRLGNSRANQSPELIKDLTQDVFLCLIKNDARGLHSFRGNSEESFLAFLYTICKNEANNYVRHIQNRDRLLGTATVDADDFGFDNSGIHPLSDQTNEEINEADLLAFMETTLKQNYRSKEIHRDLIIFRLYYLSGYTSKELIDKYDFGLTKSGIETLVNRMKNILKNAL